MKQANYSFYIFYSYRVGEDIYTYFSVNNIAARRKNTIFDDLQK